MVLLVVVVYSLYFPIAFAMYKGSVKPIKKIKAMGIFSELKDFCDEVEVPTINVYDPDYIAENIQVLKSNPIRNRFRLCDGKKRFAVRVTGLEDRTHEPKNVMECYLCGELCMNRHPQFYTKPIKTHNYIIFEDEAVISGARNYLKGHYVEIEIFYRIGDNYERGWFRVEKLE